MRADAPSPGRADAPSPGRADAPSPGRADSPRTVRAVIFDWGGTLTPWHDVDLGEQWRVFAREIHQVPGGSVGVPASDLAAAHDLAASHDLAAGHNLAAAAHELADRLLQVESAAWSQGRTIHSSAHLDHIFAEVGLDPAHDRHLRALAAYRAFWEPHTVTDPQVAPLWTALRERGIKVGVLSNTIWSGEYHREIFARDGVLDLIDGDVYSSEIPHVKPHPGAFATALAALDAEAADAVYVGDRLFEDVQGSQRAGMRAIWIPHSDIPAEQQVPVDVTPDAIAHELLDILDILDTWAAPHP